MEGLQLFGSWARVFSDEDGMSTPSPSDLAGSPTACTFGKFLDELCLSNIDHNPWGLAFELCLFLYAFGGLAIAADHLCNAMETLCDHLKVREDVAGATFMALGGSIPEICINVIVSVKAAVAHHHTTTSTKPSHQNNSWEVLAAHRPNQVALGIGAILGSGLIAFCIIPACCVLFSSSETKSLSLNRRPFLRDVSAYLVSLGILYWLLASVPVDNSEILDQLASAAGEVHVQLPLPGEINTTGTNAGLEGQDNSRRPDGAKIFVNDEDAASTSSSSILSPLKGPAALFLMIASELFIGEKGEITTGAACLFLGWYFVYFIAVVFGRNARGQLRSLRGRRPLIERDISQFRERAIESRSNMQLSDPSSASRAEHPCLQGETPSPEDENAGTVGAGAGIQIDGASSSPMNANISSSPSNNKRRKLPTGSPARVTFHEGPLSEEEEASAATSSAKKRETTQQAQVSTYGDAEDASPPGSSSPSGLKALGRGGGRETRNLSSTSIDASRARLTFDSSPRKTDVVSAPASPPNDQGVIADYRKTIAMSNVTGNGSPSVVAGRSRDSASASDEIIGLTFRGAVASTATSTASMLIVDETGAKTRATTAVAQHRSTEGEQETQGVLAVPDPPTSEPTTTDQESITSSGATSKSSEESGEQVQRTSLAAESPSKATSARGFLVGALPVKTSDQVDVLVHVDGGGSSTTAGARARAGSTLPVTTAVGGTTAGIDADSERRRPSGDAGDLHSTDSTLATRPLSLYRRTTILLTSCNCFSPSDWGEVLWAPVAKLSDAMCPDCRILEPAEHLWPVTFLSALVLIAIWSAVVTNVVGRWVTLLHGDERTLSYLGMVLVAFGAEVPDCVQSVQAARRGLGSMAIASCLGAQTLNICIGLGLPWAMVALAGKPIKLITTGGGSYTEVDLDHGFVLEEDDELQQGRILPPVNPELAGIVSCLGCVACAVGVVVVLTVFPVICGSAAKVKLYRWHAGVTMTMYLSICILLGIWTFSAQPPASFLYWGTSDDDSGSSTTTTLQPIVPGAAALRDGYNAQVEAS
ncbi:unnamed protein product [Amoebophrya sp. A120]|nr:unnamed protein product [Amoebophrya sp. A120]|eukprot:GSA120T00001393001.1